MDAELELALFQRELEDLESEDKVRLKVSPQSIMRV
jgi:hypothetical protein